ncbi:hypothetical protein TSUD_378300, partial [Trifolium subterraneum]
MNDARIKSERRDKFLEAMMEEERWRNWRPAYGPDFPNRRKKENLYPDKTYHVSADITFFNWKHHNMSVINTTDCVNFTDEVETALCAFDSAILVLSSVDGVQSQSITVDKQMIRYEFPRLVFINNVDHKGANPWQVLNQIVVEEVPADMDTLVLEKRRELIKSVSEVDDKLAAAVCSDMPISAADLE